MVVFSQVVDALALAIGVKHLCRLPLGAIAGVRLIDHRAARGGHDWYDVHSLAPRAVTLLAFLDKPTLLLELHPDAAAGAWRTEHGVRKPLKSWVAVHVDEPEAMRQAIASACERRRIRD